MGREIKRVALNFDWPMNKVWEGFQCHHCRKCDEDGYECTWKPTEPPKGPGYQVWETVSEGSPVSPVFPTKEACVLWLVGHGHSEKAARAFIQEGWVVSLVVIGGRPMMGIDAAEFMGDRK